MKKLNEMTLEELKVKIYDNAQELMRLSKEQQMFQQEIKSRGVREALDKNHGKQKKPKK